MGLVPFAGKENLPNPRSHEEMCKRAYARFRLGQTTLQIAKVMNLSEARALKYVTLGRCAAKGLEPPYV